MAIEKINGSDACSVGYHLATHKDFLEDDWSGGLEKIVDPKDMAAVIFSNERKANDPINHPKHYCAGKIECIEVTENLPFLEGNAIKYIWRHKHKNGAEDIKKSIWYCKRMLKTYYNEEV